MDAGKLKHSIVRCRLLLILYMTMAVVFLWISQSAYGEQVNMRASSFFKYSVETLQEYGERIFQEGKVEEAPVAAPAEDLETEIVIYCGTDGKPVDIFENKEVMKEEPVPIGSIYIQTYRLNVRETPNGTILGTVCMGENHDCYEERNGWFRIQYEGREGYVYGIYGDIYDAEGNLIRYADIPEPEPTLEPEKEAIREETQEQTEERHEEQPEVTQKSPEEMSTADLCQWVIAQIITPDMNDFDKVRAVNQYLCDHMTYDLNYHTTRDAILLGRGRCQGYANAFKNIMNTLGIPTDYVRGYAGGRRDATHAWNRVLIEGHYYYVDVTFNDSMGTNYYLLLTEEEFNIGRSVIVYNPASE